MNKRFNSLIAVVLAFLFTASTAFAALSNGTKAVPSPRGAEYYSAYLTSTAADTTDPADGPIIFNKDGSVKAVNACVLVTNKAGTSPTAKLQLIGSTNGSNWVVVNSADATPVAIETAATDISSSDTTNVFVCIDSTNEIRGAGGFPPFLKLRIDLGGTSPGWTGVISGLIHRN